MIRSRQSMCFDTFRKVVDDARELGVKIFQLSFFGEPLLDPGFVEKLRYLREAIPDATIALNTNGDRLDEHLVREVIRHRVDILRVSIDGSSPQEYESIRRGLNFSTIVSNASRLRKLRDDSRSGMLIQILGLNLEDYPIDKSWFSNFWGQYADETHLRHSNELKLTMHEHLFQKVVPCQFPLRELVVLASGVVTLCQGDWHGHLCFGDIHHRSIRKLWFSPRAVGFRLLHLAGLKKLDTQCKNCPYRPFSSHFQDSSLVT
jgi:radical SAM protein with 4Fe4S-binding SPASM domain